MVEIGRKVLPLLAIAAASVAAACGEASTGNDATPGGAATTAAPAGTEAAPAASTAAAAPAVTFPLEITDAAGVTHRFDKPVTKIACRYYGCIEDLADMGLVPHAAPSGDDGNAFLYPHGEPAVKIEDFDNLEEWAASESEVIVEVVGPTSIEESKTLSKAAPVIMLNAPYKVWSDSFKPGVAAWKADLELLGKITGQPERAQNAIDRFDRFVGNLKAAAPPGSADTVVANLLFTDDGTYSLMDSASPFCEALTANAIGKCAAIDGWSAESWEINAEAFLAADPPWVAYTVYSSDQSFKQREDPVWKRLTAVKNGQVFDFTRTNCCSLRVVEHALQDYAFHVWGAGGGVPDPGPEETYDPEASPLSAAA